MAEHQNLLSSYSDDNRSSKDFEGSGEKKYGSNLSTALPSRRNIFLYILSAVILFLSGAVVSIFVLGTYLNRYGHIADSPFSYEHGYSEERLLPSSLIQLEKKRFKFAVDFRVGDGVEFLVTEPDDIIYTGPPSQEIDDAWNDLLWGRYFSISEEEAKDLWGDEYRKFVDRDNSGFTGGFDAYHQLHCLNQIRQALYRDYYPETALHGGVHLDHCINHLRQAIQCWGNAAVTPHVFLEGYGHSYVKSDVVHTCRKWEPIRNFVKERFNGSLYVERPKKDAFEFNGIFDPHSDPHSP